MSTSVVEIKSIQQWVRKFSSSLVLLLLIFAACLICLLVLVDMVFEDASIVFDERIFSLIHPYINDLNTGIFKTLTFFGSVGFLLPANLLLILYFLVLKKNRNAAWKIAAVSVTNTLVLLLLKNILQRSRPAMPLIEKVHDYSFPSGHTFSSVVFYGMLTYLVCFYIENGILKWGAIIISFSLIFAIGFSRVYLRLHYASDVIAGWCLGIIWLLLAKLILVKGKIFPAVK